MSTITLNGNAHEPSACTVGELLQELGFDQKPVVIEHNKNALLKDEHERTPLNNGDSLEVVILAAGG